MLLSAFLGGGRALTGGAVVVTPVEDAALVGNFGLLEAAVGADVDLVGNFGFANPVGLFPEVGNFGLIAFGFEVGSTAAFVVGVVDFLAASLVLLADDASLMVSPVLLFLSPV